MDKTIRQINEIFRYKQIKDSGRKHYVRNSAIANKAIR